MSLIVIVHDQIVTYTNHKVSIQSLKHELESVLENLQRRRQLLSLLLPLCKSYCTFNSGYIKKDFQFISSFRNMIEE